MNCAAVSLLKTPALSMELNIKLIENGEFFSDAYKFVASDAPCSSKGCRLHNNITKSVKVVIQLWSTEIKSL